MQSAQITDISDIFNYTFAGKSQVTLVDTRTSERITFRFVRLKDRETNELQDVWFCQAQVGTGRRFAGTIFGQPGKGARFSWGKKNTHPKDSVAMGYLRAFISRLGVDISGKGRVIPVVPMPEVIQVWHEGRCGHCGRELTVPESIQNGLGPVCQGRINSDPNQVIPNFASIALNA